MNHTISSEDAVDNATNQSLIVAAVIFVIIGIFCYRRKSRKDQLERAKIRLQYRNYV